MKKTKCTRAWRPEPLLVAGEEYAVKRAYYHNGEWHLTLVNSEGIAFDAPSVFTDYYSSQNVT